MAEKDTKSEFLIKEYEFLKAELKDLVAEMNLMARYAVIASAAVFTFMTANGNNHTYDKYLAFLPLIITALFAFRTYSLFERLQLISKYIENKIESAILEGNHGWETYLNTTIKKNYPFKKSKAQMSTIIFWSVLLIFCFLLPILFR